MTATMTPLDPGKTIRFANHGRAGSQIWEAADARHTYMRLDRPGTPWMVLDNDTGAEVIWPDTGRSEWFGTLKSARQATAEHLTTSAATA
jgi:hypothetical protein